MQSTRDLQMDSKERIPSPASPDSNQVAAYAESGYPTREFAAPQQSNPNGIGESQVSALLAASSPLSHGYEDSTVGDQEAHIHPELRSIQKASPSATGNGHTSPPNMMPSAVPPQTEQGPPISGPSHQAPVSVNVAPSEMNDVVMSDGRRAKRELSQSKRAAQNRAAQRAFRQRKEQYIKKLEQEVRDYAELENNLKAVQAENYGLREYIITLQSRLLDLHGECPQPPPNVNLAPPHIPPPGVSPSAEQPGTANSVSGTATSLEVVAQAVAGLARGDHLSDSGQYPERALKSEGGEADPKSTEDSSRQAQLGNIPSAPM